MFTLNFKLSLYKVSMYILIFNGYACDSTSSSQSQSSLNTRNEITSREAIAPESILAVSPSYEPRIQPVVEQSVIHSFNDDPVEAPFDLEQCTQWDTDVVEHEAWPGSGQSILFRVSHQSFTLESSTQLPWQCWQSITTYEHTTEALPIYDADKSERSQWALQKSKQKLKHWIWILSRHTLLSQEPRWIEKMMELLKGDDIPYITLLTWDTQGVDTVLSFSQNKDEIRNRLQMIQQSSNLIPSVDHYTLASIAHVKHALDPYLQATSSYHGITSIWGIVTQKQIQTLIDDPTYESIVDLERWLSRYVNDQVAQWHWVLWNEDSSTFIQEISERLTYALQKMHTMLEVNYYRFALCSTLPSYKDYISLPALPFLAHKPTSPLNQGLDTSYCTLDEILHNKRPYPLRLHMSFNDEQSQTYQDRLTQNSKTPFQASLRAWGMNSPPVSIEAQLRGKGSLRCQRRNYKVSLPLGQHALIPDSQQSNYYLISMCLDQGYVNQLFGNALMQYLGVFPLHYRLVLLTVNDKEKGIYLLIDHVASRIPQVYPSTQLLVRRGTDIDGKPDEVKYSKDPSYIAYADYSTWRDHAANIARQERNQVNDELLLGWLSERLNISQYLTWIAGNTLIHNGDYIDEMWLYALAGQDMKGESRWQYQVIAWDMDDLFSECHYGGRYAIEVLDGLLYCTESILDHAIFGNESVQNLYVSVLKSVLTQVHDDHIIQWQARIQDGLSILLQDPKVSAAMIELQRIDPQARSPQIAQQLVRSLLDELVLKVLDEKSKIKNLIDIRETP
jgi:hypothetical protein